MILYVFDIDGTLLRADGAGAAAFERALGEIFGVSAHGRGVRFGGKTDPQILDEILLLTRGAPATVDEQTRFLACYLPHLEAALAAREVQVLAGVLPTLAALEQAPDAALGLGTGNVRGGAEAKLRRVGLHGRFAFGGYGDDSAVRAELVACAIARGRALYPSAREVVVVGDTIHDISAARACGATVVAVTTGADDAAALASADLVLDSLEPLAAWHGSRAS